MGTSGNTICNKKKLAEIIANDTTGTITDETKSLQSLVDSGTYPMAVKVNDTDYRGVLYTYVGGTTVKMSVQKFSSTEDYTTATYNREPAYLTASYADGGADNKIGVTQESLQREFNNIVNSVKKYKGYWVARYELSYGTKGESKRGKTVATMADTNTSKWYGLYDTCGKMYTGGTTKSTMITGSQWDQIMIWMKDVKNTKENKKYYIIESQYMGNYSTITGGTGARQVSGYKNEYQVKQVFDLGGNLFDWTSESASSTHRVVRGWSWSYHGYNSSPGTRDTSFTTVSYDNYSARSAMYVE